LDIKYLVYKYYGIVQYHNILYSGIHFRVVTKQIGFVKRVIEMTKMTKGFGITGTCLRMGYCSINDYNKKQKKLQAKVDAIDSFAFALD